MTSLRRFRCDDLFAFNAVNLDKLTETYNLSFYLQYLATWPEMCIAAEAPSGDITSYVLGLLTLLTLLMTLLESGKAEGEGKDWHGHVTAISVAPPYRRLKLAKKLMALLEDITETVHDGYFVDLFVRASNRVAINMYERLGYVIYRRVVLYYSGTEDALDMRRAMKRDKNKRSMVPFGRTIHPDELEYE